MLVLRIICQLLMSSNLVEWEDNKVNKSLSLEEYFGDFWKCVHTKTSTPDGVFCAHCPKYWEHKHFLRNPWCLQFDIEGCLWIYTLWRKNIVCACHTYLRSINTTLIVGVILTGTRFVQNQNVFTGFYR